MPARGAAILDTHARVAWELRHHGGRADAASALVDEALEWVGEGIQADASLADPS